MRIVLLTALLGFVQGSPAFGQFPCVPGCGATKGVPGYNYLSISTSYGAAVGAPVSCQTALIEATGDALEVKVEGSPGALVCILVSLGCDPGGCFAIEPPNYCVNVGDAFNTWGPLPGFCFPSLVTATGGASPGVWSSGTIPTPAIPPGPWLCVQAAIFDPTTYTSNPLNLVTTQAVCLEAGSWCPNGAPLNVGSDGFVQVPFAGFTFPFYGTCYSECFVGANGFITFGAGSTDPTPTVSEMLSAEPRISLLWHDLDPSATPTMGAGVKALTLPGHGVCIAFDRVPRALLGGGGAPQPLQTVCVELPDDGALRMSFGRVELAQLASPDVIVGISPGLSLSMAPPRDLSALQLPFTTADALYEDFSVTGSFDLELRTLMFVPIGVPGCTAAFSGYALSIN